MWILTPSLHREGGTERAVAEQVERWRDSFDLALYTMEVRGVDLDGVRVRRLWRPPGPHLLRFLWWLVANLAVRRLDEFRFGAPDVVHSPGINALDAGAIGVHIVFAKHWASLRDKLTAGTGRWRVAPRQWHRRAYWALLRLLERGVYGGPASLWALSRADAASLEQRFGRAPGGVPVVPYGVDAATFSPEARAARRGPARARLSVTDRRVLLLVGNDWYKKGLDRALAALALLPEAYLLAVAGRDAPEPFLRLARDRGLTPRLTFWPPTSDILEYYAAADCLVAPSREDSFHLPALEAAACGLPLVLSAEAGAGELAGVADAAVMVSDADRSDDLAGAILRVFEDDEGRARRVRAGRAAALVRTWDAYAARTADLVKREIETPRVLVLAADPWGKGGIERVTRALVRALSERFGPDRVGLMSVWGPAEDQSLPPCRLLHSGELRPGVGLTRVGPGAKSRFALAAVLAARRWRHRHLLVIACHAHLAPVAWACRVLWGTPFMVWGHGTEVWGGMRRTVAAALRRARLVFVPSRFTAAALSGEVRGLAHPPEVVPNALSGEVETGGETRDGGEPVVLSVARLNRADAYKGVDTLLLAWPQVLASRPEARMVVVGDGDDRSRLERMAAHLGVERTVSFSGQLPDPDLAAAYSQASVFALPGRARLGPRPEGEGFGMVFLEAAGAGLPCVAGRAGGAIEVVEDGVNGLLVDPESPRAVADAIVRLLGDPELARRLGQAGRARAINDFGFARFAERVGRLAESVVT